MKGGLHASLFLRSIAFGFRTRTTRGTAVTGWRATETAFTATRSARASGATLTTLTAHSTRASLTTALHHHGAHLLGTGFHFFLGHLAVGVFIHLLEAAFDLGLLRLAELSKVNGAVAILVHLAEQLVRVDANDGALTTAHATSTGTTAGGATLRTTGASRRASGTTLRTFTTRTARRSTLRGATFTARRTTESAFATFTTWTTHSALTLAGTLSFAAGTIPHAFAQTLADLGDLRHVSESVSIRIDLAKALFSLLGRCRYELFF
jgi:hypothetical protein